MLTKYIDKRHSVLVQDEELVAASGGATAHDICAYSIIAENSTDLSQQARWFITDGQLWDDDAKLENANTSNVSDGDTVTIGDNKGNSVVFEFDNNASVTGSNTSVTIGTDIADSFVNLHTAITAAISAGSLDLTISALTNGGGSIAGDTYFTLADYRLVAGDVSNHVHSLAKSATNLTATDWANGGASVSLCGFAWNHTPVFAGNALPSTTPLVSASNDKAMNLTIYCEGLQGVGLNLMGTIHYTTQ